MAGVNTPLFLEKTVLPIRITYANANIQTPILIAQGTGINNIMEVSLDGGITEYDVTATGDTSAALLPQKISGKLTLHPLSPALSAIQDVVNSYYQRHLS